MRKLLTAALCLASMGAWADTTYVLDLSGSGVWTPYCGVCGDPPLPPYPGPQPETWIGALTLTLTTDGDGVFSGEDVSAEFESNLMDISSDLFDFAGGATVTVQDGQVTSFMANLWFVNATYYKVNFSGLSANYEISNAWCHHCGDGFGSGTLAPVPEPSTWALMFGGLACLGVALIARRRPAASSVSARPRRARRASRDLRICLGRHGGNALWRSSFRHWNNKPQSTGWLAPHQTAA